MKVNEKEIMLENDYVVFLNYWKAKYPIFHKSNIFLKDLQFCIKHFFEQKDIKTSYGDVEILGNQMISFLENKGIFEKLRPKVWKLNYPDFACTTPGDPL